MHCDLDNLYDVLSSCHMTTPHNRKNNPIMKTQILSRQILKDAECRQHMDNVIRVRRNRIKHCLALLSNTQFHIFIFQTHFSDTYY